MSAKDIFTSVEFQDLIKSKLPKLFEIAEVESTRGGKIGSGVSKTTTHLIMKVGSGSSKEKKAIELGVKIMTVEQLENLLK